MERREKGRKEGEKLYLSSLLNQFGLPLANALKMRERREKKKKERRRILLKQGEPRNGL